MNKNYSNLRLRAKGLRSCTGYIKIPAKLKSSKRLRDYKIVAKRKFRNDTRPKTNHSQICQKAWEDDFPDLGARLVLGYSPEYQRLEPEHYQNLKRNII